MTDEERSGTTALGLGIQPHFPKVMLGARGPALASYGNDLVAAWRGPGDDHWLYCSALGGSSWGPRVQIAGVGSNFWPALAAFNGRLYSTWRGSGDDQGLWYSSFDGSNWAPQAQIPTQGYPGPG